MKLIVTRPQHDIITNYLSSWAEEIILLAKEKGIDVIDLFRDKANKIGLESRIKKLNPEALFFNGHGSDDYITGHDNEILIQVEENDEMLKGRITYALSCNSGKILGRKVSENNAATYIGYSDKFCVLHDRNYLTRPLQDPLANPFMRASNQVMISLLKGHGAREASERSKKLFKDHYNKLQSSKADPNSLQAAQLLRWNMRNQVCLGNGEAKLQGN